MRIQELPADEVFRDLHSGPDGLAPEEASRRLGRFGPNALPAARRQSWLVRFLRGFTHFLALLLWLAAALALLAELAEPGQGMGVLAGAIVGVVLVNGAFSFWQEFKAERMLAALARLLPYRVKTLRGGRLALVPATELVPGDVVLLAEGDRVPADARLTEARGLRVDVSTLTGEAAPASRDAGSTGEADVLDARNLLLAGTVVVSGDGKAVIYATGAQTEFGRIARLTQGDGRERSPLLDEIAAVSRVIAAMATVMGASLSLAGLYAGLPTWSALMFGIGIIVANVPEGLLPTVTLALAMAARRMARRQVVVRRLPAVETLGSTTVICTDKTGTLTLNRMAVAAAHGPEDALAAVERHCHTLKRAEGRWLGDPTEVALVEHAGPGPSWPMIGSVPFDGARKRLSTLHRTAGGGCVVYTKGAVETVLPLCTRRAVEGGVVPLDRDGRAGMLALQERLADRGLRVLALAWREAPDAGDVERDLVLAGLVGLEDPPRPEVPDAVAQARAAGIRVIMITGDHPRTAVAVARGIGLVGGAEPVVITGERLNVLTESRLMLALDAVDVVFARTGPDQKLRIVEALQRRGEVVAVTGDGVNDAPALRRGDIGIAMGRGGTDVAREAADMVLLDDNFASIVRAVEEGRAVFANIRRFMTYILTSNVPEIVPYLAFVLLGIPLPLTVVQILAVDLGTDMLPALALGAEPPHEGVLKRPPRPRTERLLTRGLLARAYLLLGPFEAAAAMAAYFLVLWAGGWGWGEALAPSDPLYRAATTACFSAIVVAQVANVYLCRSERRPAFGSPWPRNRLIAVGIAFEVGLALAIVYTAPGHLLFGTASLPWWAWLGGVPFVLAMVLADEARKRRRRAPEAPVRRPW